MWFLISILSQYTLALFGLPALITLFLLMKILGFKVKDLIKLIPGIYKYIS
jgi:hypothetical protein